jgi:penicillin amidase
MQHRSRNWLACVIFVIAFWGIFFGLGYRFVSSPTTAGVLVLDDTTSQTGLREATAGRLPIEIDRDQSGMVSIHAQKDQDAYWALGFVHGQDRLWQMDFNRRVIKGQVSEILGSSTLALDKRMRVFGFELLANKQLESFKKTDPHLIDLLQHYTDGVNEAIRQQQANLPVEFLLLKTSPAPWTMQDSLLMTYLLAMNLGANAEKELNRFRFISLWSDKNKFQDFFPPYPGESYLVDLDYQAFYKELGLVPAKKETLDNGRRLLEQNRQASLGGNHQTAVALTDLSTKQSDWIEEASRGLAPSAALGSNSWVISGSASISGKPILANDPHLRLNNPQIWYMVSLSSPGLSVSGASMAGLPMVVLGRNHRIAWGFTNSGADVQDVYLERLDSTGKKYWRADGWQPLKKRQETIRVRGKPDETWLVYSTDNGPIVSQDVASANKAMKSWQSTDPQYQYALSLAWTVFQQNETLAAGVEMNRATNWGSFRQAVSRFDAPIQNILYADIDGNTAWILPGLVPKRGQDHFLKGWLPVPAWNEQFSWQGIQEKESAPYVLNASAAWLVSANGKMDSVKYPYFVTADWELPYRQERVSELLAQRLSQKTPVDVSTVKAIQMDQQSQMFKRLLPYFRQLSPDQMKTEDEKRLLKEFLQWDGEMKADGWKGVLATWWFRQWAKKVFEDDLGSALYLEYASPATMFWPLWNVLEKNNQSWCDDTRSTMRETCLDQMKSSFEESVFMLTEQMGIDEQKWHWGELHALLAEHQPMSFSSVGDLFSYSIPVGGDPYSVNVSNYLFYGSVMWRTQQVAGLRAVYDLSDPSQRGAFFNWPLANSGLASKQQNQIQLRQWVNGQYEQPLASKFSGHSSKERRQLKIFWR